MIRCVLFFVLKKFLRIRKTFEKCCYHAISGNFLSYHILLHKNIDQVLTSPGDYGISLYTGEFSRYSAKKSVKILSVDVRY